MSQITFPFRQALTSLAAVAATGAGASASCSSGVKAYALQVSTTGAPVACVVNLEGTLDGTNWFTLTTWSSLTSGAIVWAVDKPALAIRANLATLTAGAAPTVTATISAI